MKPYQVVVSERYNGVEKNVPVVDNVYSFINPVGFYGDRKLRELIYKVFQFIRIEKPIIDNLTILDIGSGKGSITRLFSDITEKPDNIYGFDLSSTRINQAKQMNPIIHYEEGDITNKFPFNNKFDIISAFDCLMHIPDEISIIKSLKNIKFSLKDDGYFVWFDAYSKDHFFTNETQDHSGFSPKQMDKLCSQVELKLVYQDSLFKLIFNKYHTAYLSKRIPIFALEILETIIPTKPGNIIRIYKKV